VLACRLIGASRRRRRTDFEPDSGRCLSCGRCFRYCPQEQIRLHPLPEP
jgi:ferredoxin